MARPELRGLYAITPETADDGELLVGVEAVLAGGCRLIQYRDKISTPERRRARAAALLARCRAHGAALILNDDLALCLAIDADGVHLGQDDGDLAAARAALGPDKLLGASCYAALDNARRAVAAGADYVAFGAVYPSPTKPAAVQASIELFAHCRTEFDVPICAIGGITLDNAPPLIAAGADLLAVITDLFSAPDVAVRASAYQTLFEEKTMTTRNQELFDRAQRHIPGGVNSPVRAFRSVGGTPRFFKKGEGARVLDVDGKWYVDYVGSWGPMIVGHSHQKVVRAVQLAAADGLSFGAPTEREIEMADLLCQLVPSMDMVRLVSSGTEATMSAIRLARGYTGRDLLIKFEGCYHGHSDSLLVKAGSGALTFGNPSSGGVPADLAQHTMVLGYNQPQQLADAFARFGDRIAAVIVEPVVGNMNLIAPLPEFLSTMRELTAKHGAVLIFDEVMTGFRVGLKSAQGLYGITPDLSTFGKVIGGGMPVGAFGGRREIMQKIAPLGPVYQAGTLSGNPVAVAAGLATLKLVQAPGFYEHLTARTRQLCDGLEAAAKKHGVAFCAQNVGGMFGLYFAERCPTTYEEVLACDKEAFNQFFHAMLEAGHYFAPSAYEAGFVSAAHTEADIASTLAVADAWFANRG